VRIDHIGSTAVPGLAAKPVIDVQISVPALDPAKVPHFWDVIAAADRWAQAHGWEPAASDA
jgi:GrpB-like predicted nucleotidyltransferase (UPF0157 family)